MSSASALIATAAPEVLRQELTSAKQTITVLSWVLGILVVLFVLGIIGAIVVYEKNKARCGWR